MAKYCPKCMRKLSRNKVTKEKKCRRHGPMPSKEIHAKQEDLEITKNE